MWFTSEVRDAYRMTFEILRPLRPRLVYKFLGRLSAIIDLLSTVSEAIQVVDFRSSNITATLEESTSVGWSERATTCLTQELLYIH